MPWVQVQLIALQSMGSGYKLDTSRLAQHDAAQASAARQVLTGYRVRRASAPGQSLRSTSLWTGSARHVSSEELPGILDLGEGLRANSSGG